MGVMNVMCGRGDEKVTLGDNGAENKTKVDEYLNKKYLVMVSVGEGDQKTDKKVTSFDAEKNEFVIDESETKTVTETKTTRVPAINATATVIAPTAGG